jgi:hypothetical protein
MRLRRPESLVSVSRLDVIVPSLVCSALDGIAAVTPAQSAEGIALKFDLNQTSSKLTAT